MSHRRRIATNAGVQVDIRQLRQLAVNIARIDAMPHAPEAGAFKHGHIVACNDSLLVQSSFSEPLTSYATGWRPSDNLDEITQFLAPSVAVTRRFEFAAGSNVEAFLSETTDDLRPPRGDFKAVEFTSEKVDAHTENRGLTINVDLDDVADKRNWREQYTGMLMRRLKLNKFRRAWALALAAATNTGKAWDATAGKDPDQDVGADLVVATTSSGVRPNRVLYGDTAWSKRQLSHRAQNTAGGFASAGMTPEQVAAFLTVDGVKVSKSRYQSSATAKSEVVGGFVLMFTGQDSPSEDDPSNLKDFWSPCEGGEQFRVYEQQINAKKYAITVEHYEKLALTTALGMRKFTVS